MKKTKKIISWLAASVIICNMCSFSFAAVKRDVNDPVLREIINELSRKMPKFIDKYGETVFVEDEPITRGALLSAIYEYDKRVKSSITAEEAVSSVSTESISQITRQEFDALRAKIMTLEKSRSASSPASKSSSGSVDMVALISDLTPNMPMLLDNSLNNSKVFKSLQQQVTAGGSKSSSQDGISYMASKEFKEINIKLDGLSKRLDLAESSSLSASRDGVAVNKEFKEINTKLGRLSKRLDLAESGSMSASQEDINDLRNNLNQIRQSYVKLSKKIDELNDRTLVFASSYEKSSVNFDMNYINKQLSDIKKTVAGVPTSSEVKSEINKNKNQTQNDIKRIEKRLNDISSSTSSKPSGSSGSSGGSGGTTIATISLGITMIAALFVAR
ncbi:MAG: hypothetical protein LBD46_02575 [Endomicrobium sp.]|jgi:tetrahydromethanopterin S-methyltransferase subunit G|nr:hypothetical protein [Endomicrobium sp.]